MPTILKDGSRGGAVKKLQDALNRLNRAGLVVDGIFGPKTAAAVEKYQRTRFLDVDGVVGANTLAALRTDGVVIDPSDSTLPDSWSDSAVDLISSPSSDAYGSDIERYFPLALLAGAVVAGVLLWKAEKKVSKKGHR